MTKTGKQFLVKKRGPTFLGRGMYGCWRPKRGFGAFFFFFFFFFCWKRLIYLPSRTETTAQRYLWLNRHAVVKGIQITSPSFICILKEYNTPNSIVTMPVLIARAPVVEIQSVIRHLVFWQILWSPSDIYQEVYEVYGQQCRFKLFRTTIPCNKDTTPHLYKA